MPCHPACVATLLLLSFCELIHVICSVSEHERRKENFQEIDYDLCGFVKNVPFQTEHEAASLTCSLPGDSLSSSTLLLSTTSSESMLHKHLRSLSSVFKFSLHKAIYCISRLQLKRCLSVANLEQNRVLWHGVRYWDSVRHGVQELTDCS